MTFRVEEIVYDHQEETLGITYEGDPTPEEQAVVEEMMQAFGALIAKEQERAQQFMMMVLGESGEVH